MQLARPRALTAEQEDRVLDLSPHHTNRQIAEIMADEGVSVSASTIARLLAGVRKERAETSREVVRERLREHVLSDLDILQVTRDQLNCWRRNLQEDGKTPIDPPLRIGERLLIIDRLRGVIAERLKAGGVTEDDKTIRIQVVDPDEDEEHSGC